MTHPEVQELLGVYALDAVDRDESTVIEAHLAECPSCRAEVAAHRETAAKLGNVGGIAPGHLWDLIASGLVPGGELGPGLPMPPNVVRFPFRRTPAAPIAAVLAAAIVLIVLLGLSTLHLQNRVNALGRSVNESGLRQAAAAAVFNPNHTIVRLASANGRLDAEVVAVPGGQAYLVNGNLPAVSADHTYQLWGLDEGKVVSLGLLGSHPELVAFRIDPAVSRLMVTAEPEGGRPTPDLPILIQGQV